MKIIKYMATAAIAAMAISSCEEDASTIGESLTNEADKLNIAAVSYDVSTRTIVADSVFTLSTNCYLGKIQDPETKADVKSEFTTQFHLLENFSIVDESKIVSRYDGKVAADSCDIILYLSSPFNAADSLQAVKMQLHELVMPMEESQRYYSNYNPAKLGMLSDRGLGKSKMFTYLNLSDNDSARQSTTYMKNIRISLNDPYTDKEGNTYNNYGTFLLQQYFTHPEYFRNSYTFAHNICPGVFFEIKDGMGFYSKVSDIGLRTFYRIQKDTTVAKASFVLAGTQEVLQTTLITNDKEAIRRLANESEHTYLKSPAGLFTEVTLPVDDIKRNHINDSLIAAKIVFQRLNNESSDSRMLGIPQTLLMIEKDSLHAFFENNKKADNKTTFTTTYDVMTTNGSSTKVYKNIYAFENISNLITTLWNQKKKGLETNSNWVAEHPNWNKVVLVPITVSSTSTEHDMSLTSTRLVGGPNNPNEPIKISVVYAKFKEQ